MTIVQLVGWVPSNREQVMDVETLLQGLISRLGYVSVINLAT